MTWRGQHIHLSTLSTAELGKPVQITQLPSVILQVPGELKWLALYLTSSYFFFSKKVRNTQGMSLTLINVLLHRKRDRTDNSAKHPVSTATFKSCEKTYLPSLMSCLKVTSIPEYLYSNISNFLVVLHHCDFVLVQPHRRNSCFKFLCKGKYWVVIRIKYIYNLPPKNVNQQVIVSCKKCLL